VDRFYRQRHGQLFWFGAGGAERREQLLVCIDSAAWLGLDSMRYHPEQLRQLAAQGDDSAGRLLTWDRQYTDAAFALATDLYRQAGIGKAIAYDGISPVYAGRDDDTLLAGLLEMGVVGVGRGLQRFEPVSAEYDQLKSTLRSQMDSGNVKRAARLSGAMNMYRWIHHFPFDRFLVVNIPSATLSYYAGDTVSLRMRVVAGQPSKRTPRFAAYTASDLPYTLRQEPGCQNALGVLKFDINSPFDVYMHDTNLKKAFTSPGVI
jgi:L,D-transpeptidase YcbB